MERKKKKTAVRRCTHPTNGEQLALGFPFPKARALAEGETVKFSSVLCSKS